MLKDRSREVGCVIIVKSLIHNDVGYCNGNISDSYIKIKIRFSLSQSNKNYWEVIVISCVYKITNDINNKIYIGATTFPLAKRWNEHLSDAKKSGKCHRPFYAALNEFGVSHFHISELEKCSDDILYEREKYWIQFYNSYIDGYNATFGGKGKQLFDKNYILEKLQNGNTACSISQELGCCPDIISDLAYDNGIDISSNSKVVYEQTIKGVFCRWDGLKLRFKSLSDAARFISIIKEIHFQRGIVTHISECCRGKRKSAYGCLWEYV